MHGPAVGWWLAAGVGIAIVLAERAAAISPADALVTARELAQAAGPGGHAQLAAQADRLAGLPPEALVPCLEAFRDATPAGGNWLRSGLDRAVDRLGTAVSVDALVTVVSDAQRPPRARSLAHGWLKRLDPTRATAVLDGLLDDPAADLRREAVDRLLASAADADEAAAKEIHRRGLAAARDVDQIERIAGWLTERGEKVDVADVLGFVRRWRVSEAFDNAGGVGFARVFPPEEQAAAPEASAWRVVASADKHGAVDLNAAIAARKGVLAYAVAEVEMPRAGSAEVRIGSPCAVAVWVNGRPVMAHEIYHASEAIDQYRARAEFRAGTNTVLVKCCQNEQTEPWAADWKFQLRITDPLGTPLATQREGESR